ncbi:glycoside hydrolase family 16 protein [Methylobacterium nodulans]|nr:glycoside hydrolase family 16 protein [Methylobacterium nodulans]
MPRLFAGATYVFSPARADNGVSTILTIPLAPTAANLTQTIYFVGDAICFLIFSAYACRPGVAHEIVRAIIWCSLVNLLFVLADLATYYTSTTDLLSFIRNSAYRMLDDTEVNGLKRIVGSFTEAGAFAYTTLALLAFNLRLWSEGIAPRATGLLALLSLIAITFATSSTGYVGLSSLLALQFVLGTFRLLNGRATVNIVMLLGLAPAFLALLVAAILLNPEVSSSVNDMIQATLFNKLSSDSGIERSAWNRQAIVAIRDTLWLGAGIGSLRASSWLIAVPASIGAFGAAGYGAFVLAALFKRGDADDTVARAVRLGARDACIVQVIAASVAGAFIDLGLNFFLYAAIAAGALPSALPRRAGARYRPFTAPRCDSVGDPAGLTTPGAESAPAAAAGSATRASGSRMLRSVESGLVAPVPGTLRGASSDRRGCVTTGNDGMRPAASSVGSVRTTEFRMVAGMYKRCVVLAALLLTAGGTCAAKGLTRDEREACGLTPVFTDDFTTESISARELGATRWTAHTPWNGDFGDAMFSDPGPGGPFAVADGILRITAKRNEDGRWRSGLIAASDYTGAGRGTQYGYFEARMKLPPGPGTWPAFWLTTLRPADAKGTSVEIDVLEYYGHEPRAMQSALHVWSGDPNIAQHLIKTTSLPPEALVNDFHTYGVWISREDITFYLDRAAIWRVATPKALDLPMYPLVNLALGSGFSIENTPDPSTLLVDYVHVYAAAPATRPETCWPLGGK